jgi:glucokinase
MRYGSRWGSDAEENNKEGEMGQYVIGADIGGTKIACGIVNEKGKVLARTVLPTLADKGFKISLEQVYLAIAQTIKMSGMKMAPISGIGVCAPGPLDPVKGVVHNPPNLKGWRDVPLAELLRKKFRKKVKLENDANAAGMAELRWGSAKGYANVLYVTVSTGIGTAVIINGSIYHGKNGMAGEGGHVSINFDDETALCKCGNRGCIEALASGTYTAKRFADRIRKGQVPFRGDLARACGGKLENLSMKIIGDAARRGSRHAIGAIEEEGRLIGIWLGGMISVLDPEVIVIGGGVAALGNMFFKAIRKAIPASTINVYASKTPVVPASLKRDVGICGAASIMTVKKRSHPAEHKRK